MALWPWVCYSLPAFSRPTETVTLHGDQLEMIW